MRRIKNTKDFKLILTFDQAMNTLTIERGLYSCTEYNLEPIDAGRSYPIDDRGRILKALETELKDEYSL